MIFVSVCTPTGGFVRGRYTTSLMRMFQHYMNTPVFGREHEERRFSYHTIESSTIGAARDWFVDDILQLPSTHLLFIDDDMGFREDTLHILLSRQMPVVACNYRVKVPPCTFTAMGLDGKRIETNSGSDSLIEAEYTGMGFTLIERQVLEAVKKPRFLNVWENGNYSTEDRPFCLAAKAAGFPVMVDQRASKRVFHMGNYNYSWDDDFPAERAIPIAERSK